MFNANTRLALGFTFLSGCYNGPSDNSLDPLPPEYRDAGVFDARTPSERAAVCLGIGDSSRTLGERTARLKFSATQVGADHNQTGCLNVALDRFTVDPNQTTGPVSFTAIARPSFLATSNLPGVPTDGGLIGGQVARLIALQGLYTGPVSGTITLEAGNSCLWNINIPVPRGLAIVLGATQCTATNVSQVTEIPVSTPQPGDAGMSASAILRTDIPRGMDTVSGSSSLCSPNTTSCPGAPDRSITVQLTLSPTVRNDGGVSQDVLQDVSHDASSSDDVSPDAPTASDAGGVSDASDASLGDVSSSG